MVSLMYVLGIRGINEFDQMYVKAEFARISAIKLGQLSIDEPHSSYHLIVISDYHLNLRECRLVSQERGDWVVIRLFSHTETGSLDRWKLRNVLL